MTTVKISVLIYVLNDNSHIENCLHSVMNQTLREIEILVIDGGSTDGTLEQIEHLASEDHRIKILHTSPGVGHQFNVGLHAASGEYIGICESDDCILPDMYETQYVAARQNRLDVLWANFYRFCEMDGKRYILPFTAVRVNLPYHTVLNSKKDRDLLRMGVNGFWSGLYRREFLLSQKIFMNETPGASYQDTSFAFLAGLKAERAMVLKDAFYCYRWDNPCSSVNAPGKMNLLIKEYALLKKRLQKEKLFAKCKEEYLSWKIDGLFWFYDRLPGELHKEYVSMMYQDICQELRSEEYQKSEISLQGQKLLNKLYVSQEVLLEYLCSRDAELDKMKQRLEQLCREQEIVIFGSGNIGKLIGFYLSLTGRKAVAYMDNKNTLWGKKEGILPIMEPEKAVAVYPNAVYIVANAVYHEEMKKQLLEYSVKEENIVECVDYGFLLNSVLPSS